MNSRLPTSSSKFYAPEVLRADENSLSALLRRAQASIGLQVERRLAPHDLTHAQWVPLYKLAEGNCTTMAALARGIALDPAATTRALDRLEDKGLIKRERSLSDRRVVNLALTDEGERMARLVPVVLSEVLNAHLVGFTQVEWAALVDLLKQVIANGDRLRRDCEGAGPSRGNKG